MKNTFIVISLLVVLLLSLRYNYIQHKEAAGMQERVKLLERNNHKQDIIIRRVVYPDSSNHVHINAPVAETRAEKNLAISPGYIDSLKMALKIKDEQLVAVERIRFESKATLPVERTLDTVRKSYFVKAANRWMSVQYNTADDSLKYRYNAELVRNRFYAKTWYGGKRWYTDYGLADTNAVIVNARGFREPDPKKKRFGLGVQASRVYIPQTGEFAWGLGVGLSYNLITF